MADQTFAEWCVVEMLGHRRTGGHVTEQEVAGAKFLRIDIPATPGYEPMTQLVNPSSIYALTPTTEELATAAARLSRPEPVSRWQLGALRSPDGDPLISGDFDEDNNGGPF